MCNGSKLRASEKASAGEPETCGCERCDNCWAQPKGMKLTDDLSNGCASLREIQ
jgi:hypothetical protein